MSLSQRNHKAQLYLIPFSTKLPPDVVFVVFFVISVADIDVVAAVVEVGALVVVMVLVGARGDGVAALPVDLKFVGNGIREVLCKGTATTQLFAKPLR